MVIHAGHFLLTLMTLLWDENCNPHFQFRNQDENNRLRLFQGLRVNFVVIQLSLTPSIECSCQTTNYIWLRPWAHTGFVTAAWHGSWHWSALGSSPTGHRLLWAIISAFLVSPPLTVPPCSPLPSWKTMFSLVEFASLAFNKALSTRKCMGHVCCPEEHYGDPAPCTREQWTSPIHGAREGQFRKGTALTGLCG